jgi:hypothetical protein
MTIAAGLSAAGPSGFTVLAVPSGDQNLTALTTPEVFDFTSVNFGHDTIVGFDPTKDAIRLSSSLASSFVAEMANGGNGTLITFGATHSLTLAGVDPASLSPANFRFT